jgi:nicotinate-nucleotide pyrophosphorylase (carboxylating)
METEKLLKLLKPHIRMALKEDCPQRDITTGACVDARQKSEAFVVSKQPLVLSGVAVFAAVMKMVDGGVKVVPLLNDGQRAGKGAVIMKIYGRAASILRAERVALNYMQRMCGIATITAQYVALVRGTKAKILDTRKTTPTLRLLEKYAVVCGGGVNHRMSLSDVPLIKENHIRAAGGIRNAVGRVKKTGKRPVILEVTDENEILEGLSAQADILLLDNMTPAQVKRAVKLINGKALVEVSGNINLKTARKYALAGAQRLSIGALTHSAPSADLSLLFVP